MTSYRSHRSGQSPRFGKVRIIGGRFRGRAIPYRQAERTRPMKDRVREALFSLLGPTLPAIEVIDLFAGTGALGLESLSRGARRAIFVEQHLPTAEALRSVLARWQVLDQADVIPADAFFWLLHDWKPSDEPVLLFCSPPYAFYHERRSDMLRLLEHFFARSSSGSQAIVESDTEFDVREHLPDITWHVRDYPPTRLAIGQSDKLTKCVSADSSGRESGLG